MAADPRRLARALAGRRLFPEDRGAGAREADRDQSEHMRELKARPSDSLTVGQRTIFTFM